MAKYQYDNPEEAYKEAQRRIQQALADESVKLDLSKLGLTAVPPEIGQLTNLRELDLRWTQLTALPPEITQLTGLRELYLHHNQLTAMPPEIGQLTGLQLLDLGGNQLTAVPPEIGQLTGLRELDLSSNQLTAVPPVIAQLTGLQTLYLYKNQLTALPPEIGQLTGLQTLYLGHNQLTAVPEWLVQMPKLEGLYIYHNPITQPPPELLGEALTETDHPQVSVDLEAVRHYYAQLAKEGEAFIYEAKLLLIGEGGAGKTSLARKLRNPAAALPAAKESTEGIDVMQWQFPLAQDLSSFENLTPYFCANRAHFYSV